MEQKFDITGMTCSACAGHVEKAVKKLPGVEHVAVNLLQNSMRVSYDNAALTPQAITAAVEHAGYGAFAQPEKGATVAAQPEIKPAELEEKSMKQRLIISICFLAPLMYISMGHMAGAPLPPVLAGLNNAISYGMAQFLLTMPIMYVNRKYYQNGFKSLFHGAPTMDSLIALGSMAAVVYGVYAILMMGVGLAAQDWELVSTYHMDLYFESAGTILTLITVGKYLESRSKGKTGDAISRLMDLAPKTAVIERDGTEVEVPLDEVTVGDVLIVKSGAGIPVDGSITEGGGTVDESALTGESLPVDKQPGDKVTGGTVCRSGWLRLRAEHVGSDTTLSRIIRLVEEAGAGKAPIAKLADRVSAVFVPIVITVAVVATVVWLLVGQPLSFALSIGIAVLVISCPCALGLATPTAIMVGTGKGAEHGILFKTAESLETAHTVDTVVFDKTGTVTEGAPSVVGIIPAQGAAERTLLALAAAIERPSEHPLAQAIVEHADALGIDTLQAQDFVQTPGQGVHATVDGKKVLGGNEKMMREQGIETAAFTGQVEAMALQGQTPLYFAEGGRLLGVIALADTVKPTSAAAVAQLHDMGVRTVLLTGDNERTAQAIARRLGIDTVIAEVLPEQKEAQVRALQEQGRKVAMVGDGINDAPALARADVGIAIGAGTDIAIESADIVLMKSDPLDIPTALQLSAATLRNIKQNLFWAFFYNAVGIPLAAGVFYAALGWKLNPMFAAAAMSLSSLFVVTNALRLRFWRPQAVRGRPRGLTAGGGSGDTTNASTERTTATAPQIAQATAENAPVSAQKEQTVQNMEEKEMPIIIPDEGEKKMKRTMIVEGMTCGHCSARVKQALEAVSGVDHADVYLDTGTVELILSADVADASLKNAVEQAGYGVVTIG